MKDSRALVAYLHSVAAITAPVLAFVTIDGAGAMPHALSGRLGLIVGLFCVVLVLGEMWPIRVARGQEVGDEITVSSTFGFALMLIAPIIVAVTAQALALIIDAVVRRRAVNRLLFNIAQYALAFVCARAVYAAVSSQPFTPDFPVPLPELLPALAAGATFLLVNNSLVAVAVAISTQVRLRSVLINDLRWQITTSAPLLGLGPLAVQAMFWTPVSIVLLLMPIVALHHSGNMAMRSEQEALRDALTGLANRAMLTAAAERTLAESVGQNAMLLLDLDHFKDINDTLGHSVGDQMLIAVADRLQREAGANDLVGRLGGDEFVVLARNLTDRNRAVELAERLCAVVREPVVLGGVTLTVGCSVGIAFGGDHADTVSDLLRCADIALYDAKVTRGNAAIYRKEVDRHSATRLGLQADLRHALESDTQQIWIAFQPQYDLATGLISSVECLARWKHPELGEISPDVFIPIAEATSLIDLVLDRVLDVTLTQLAVWDLQGVELSACVNLSARQLSDMSLPATVRNHLTRHGMPADRLVLEVTESRLMSDPEHSAEVVRRLHDLGVQISIDDFGTGYSSLSYLQRLDVHELKIDKSFTSQLKETGNATIVRSTIELGHNLGLRVVAEGVEDSGIAAQLARLGCDLLQGYLIAPPVHGDRIPALVGNLPAVPADVAIAASGPRIVELVPSDSLRKAQ